MALFRGMIVLLIFWQPVIGWHLAWGGEVVLGHAPLISAQAALQSGAYDQAVKLFTHYLSGAERDPVVRQEALEGRCTALYKQSLVEQKVQLAQQAIADCSELIRLNGQQVRGWRLRGVVRMVTGRLEKALINFNQALLQDGADVASLRYRGMTYAGLGQIAKAKADFAAALRLDPDDAWSYFNQGLLLGRSGQMVAAQASFLEFVRLRGAKGVEMLTALKQDKTENGAVRQVADDVLKQKIATLGGSMTPAPVETAVVAPVEAALVEEASKPPAVAPVEAAVVEAVTQNASFGPPDAVERPTDVFVASRLVPVDDRPSTPLPLQEYVFKVGSYQDRGNVQDTLKSLVALKVPMYEEEAEVGGRMFYRIWAGPFGDVTTARTAYQQVTQLPGQEPEPIRLR